METITQSQFFNNNKKNKNEKQKPPSDLWLCLGGEEVAQYHVRGWIYATEGLWVDRDGEFHHW